MRSFHRIAAAAAGLAAGAVVLAACTGSGAAPAATRGAAASDVLTVGFGSQGPPTLDPAKAPPGDAWFDELAYEPLVVQRSDGSLAPGLATSWSYVGSGNTEFLMNIRPGVDFSDGTPLTAQDVADSLRHVQSSGGPLAPLFAGDTVTATGPMTVVIKAARQNPDFPQILTQDDIVGDMISENGLRNPSQLATQTFGAGPYMLSPSQTVAGRQYTYVLNPNYDDPVSQYWNKVVIKIITSPQQMLSALKTGQVQVADGDPATIAAAKAAGLTVTAAPDLWEGVTLADRNGTISRPLASTRVRQALNYATDRRAISAALFPGTGSPTSQLSVPGGYGYQASLTNAYPYSLARAKRLLASAGYARGFPLTIVTTQDGGMDQMARALAQQWRKVGVRVSVTDYPSESQYQAQALAARYPAFMTVAGQVPTWLQGPSLFLPPATYNPFHTASATLSSLYAQEAQSSGPQQARIDEQIDSYLVKNAWFVPVAAVSQPYFATGAVRGTGTSPRAPLLDLYEVQPSD